MKRTKIICTIGPSCDSQEMLTKMINAGMNCCRLNFSHNTLAYHVKTLKRIRSCAKKMKTSVAVIADLQGPRIRLGILPREGIKVQKNDQIVLTTKKNPRQGLIPVTYHQMHLDVAKGQRILIADGLIELTVERVRKNNIYCQVKNSGVLFSNKGINLPDTQISLSALTAKDKTDLQVALKHHVDYVALSFVRSGADVEELRSFIDKHSSKNKIGAKIIVKIERQEAIEKLDEIIAAADAVMVARGDLGIEMPSEEVPLLQKTIIAKCLSADKPVIVATQMLESMISHPRPTRAEVSDVANAVIDHTDAVMLSGETANGRYSLEAVVMMKKIIAKTENSAFDDLHLRQGTIASSLSDAMSQVAKVLSERTDAKLILGISYSGYTARLISRYRPEIPIIIAVEDENLYNQLALLWGVSPFMLKNSCDFEKKAKQYLIKNKFVKKGDKIIVVAPQTGQGDKIRKVELEII